MARSLAAKATEGPLRGIPVEMCQSAPNPRAQQDFYVSTVYA